MADVSDVAKFRDYVGQVDGERWADAIDDMRIARAVADHRVRLRLSGKSRGWLGAVHAELKREREGEGTRL